MKRKTLRICYLVLECLLESPGNAPGDLWGRFFCLFGRTLNPLFDYNS